MLDVCCSWLLGDVADSPQRVIELLNIRIDQHQETMNIMKDNLDTKNLLIKKLQAENKDMETQLMTLGRMTKIFEGRERRFTKNGAHDKK